MDFSILLGVTRESLAIIKDFAIILAFTFAASTYFFNWGVFTRNKKKAALELLETWVKREESWSRAIEFTASLEIEQAVNFWRGESINKLTLDDNHRGRIRQEELASICLRYLESLESNSSKLITPNSVASNQLLLTAKQVIEIRRYAFSYLNIVEIVLLAWRENIVDQDLIYEQFSPLISNDKFPGFLFKKEFDISLCKNLKNSDNCPKTPQECHPSIGIFYFFCRNKNSILKWDFSQKISLFNANQLTGLSFGEIKRLKATSRLDKRDVGKLAILCQKLKYHPEDLLKID